MGPSIMLRTNGCRTIARKLARDEAPRSQFGRGYPPRPPAALPKFSPCPQYEQHRLDRDASIRAASEGWRTRALVGRVRYGAVRDLCPPRIVRDDYAHSTMHARCAMATCYRN